MLSISKNDLKYILNNSKFNSDTQELNEWKILLKECGLDINAINEILKQYISYETNNNYFSMVKKVLNDTCKIKDYNDYVSHTFDEHPHPRQKNIHHNYVSEYKFVYVKRLPLKFIKNFKTNNIFIRSR